LYSLRILGENFSKTSQWELKQGTKTHTPNTLYPEEMRFEKIEFQKAGLQLFSIKVNQKSINTKKAVVKNLKFTFKK
jgi:hypothetical protein